MYYKHLSLDNGNLVSSGVWGEYRVIYKPGIWTETSPLAAEKGYYLCVFSDYTYIRNFSGIIYKCQCEEEVPLPKWCDLYRLSEYGIFIPTEKDWPKGTKMFKRVKLIQNMSWNIA